MRDEFLTLNETTQIAVQSVIEQARAARGRISVAWKGGDIYAYPQGDGIAWGVNDGDDGNYGRNTARGVR